MLLRSCISQRSRPGHPCAYLLPPAPGLPRQVRCQFRDQFCQSTRNAQVPVAAGHRRTSDQVQWLACIVKLRARTFPPGEQAKRNCRPRRFRLVFDRVFVIRHHLFRPAKHWQHQRPLQTGIQKHRPGHHQIDRTKGCPHLMYR